MAHDFDLHRLTDKLKRLTEEQTRVKQQILTNKRDEHYEQEYIHRKYSGQIHALEETQDRIAREMTTHERQLHNLEKNIRDEKAEADQRTKR